MCDSTVYSKGVFFFNEIEYILFYFLLIMLCRIFGVAENHALFALKFVSIKFGLCKENDILQIWAETN